ncbi:4-alpha-glucanotransferase [bacterium HR23]|nr:4-alpha-glucanotransferase [bacterium HR23]
MDGSLSLLSRLARLYGVLTAYTDASRQRRQPPPESILAVLQALGAPIASWRDLPSALRHRRQELWQQVLEPVLVAWNGAPPPLRVHLPTALADATLVLHLTEETGVEHRWAWRVEALSTRRTAMVEGTRYLEKEVILPLALPWGYHHLVLEVEGRNARALLISTPREAFLPPEGAFPTWGLFLPLYALRTCHTWGSGDFSALASLVRWVANLGGGMVATLPLLAAFLEEPCHPSPYSPVSRLLWNEFYVDIPTVPELQDCPDARDLVGSPNFQASLRAFRSSLLVDYRSQMALKRRVLHILALHFQTRRPSQRWEAFQRFLQEHRQVEDYARFRAVGERYGHPWRTWPQPLRNGAVGPGDYDPANAFYHQYVQWLAHQQMEALARTAQENDTPLLLDFPLGVHPDGYDAWRERGLFVEGVSVGAPPDAFFSKGQNWAFRPLHPQRLRQQGYRYFIASLRHLLPFAGILRIDHVMGFHRLFWIPQGTEAKEGVYVRYPADEFYALLALESQRHRVVVVGEDLGTVPPEVRPAMSRHRLYRSYVLPFGLSPSRSRAIAPVPAQVIASLNTHDMPPFLAFWKGEDIRDRRALGLLDEAGVAQEKAHRQALRDALTSYLLRKGWLRGDPQDPRAVLEACLAFLAHSPAHFLLVNLEDLWLETTPQNVPGTSTERPNWRRKARYTLEEFSTHPQVAGTLRMLTLARPPRAPRRPSP